MSLEEWLKAREGKEWTAEDTAFVSQHVVAVERTWAEIAKRAEKK